VVVGVVLVSVDARAYLGPRLFAKSDSRRRCFVRLHSCLQAAAAAGSTVWARAERSNYCGRRYPPGLNGPS
jgi:hypothetical protein